MAATLTEKLIEKKTINELKAVLKAGKARDNATHHAMLAKIAKLTEELKGLLVDPTPTTTEEAQPTDETPIWLATKAEIEEWLRKRWSVKTVRIISGLENDQPVISSPKELAPMLVNVHKEGDPGYVRLDEKCRRARDEHGIRLGLREVLLCHIKRQDIHKEWYPHWAYFGETIFEVNDRRCVVCLIPDAGGCGFYYRWLNDESGGYDRFACLGESA